VLADLTANAAYTDATTYPLYSCTQITQTKNTVVLYGKTTLSNVVTATSNLTVLGGATLSNGLSAYGPAAFLMPATDAPSVGVLGGLGDRLVAYKGSATEYPYAFGVDASSNGLWASVPLSAQHQWFQGGAAVMTLSNAMLGVGMTNPANSLDVVGSIRASVDITALSDARVKTDLVRVPDAVAKVGRLNGYTFRRVDGADPADPRRYLGVVAQEVLAVLPEAVQGSLEAGYSVAYGNLAALLIEAFKDMSDTVNGLSARLDRAGL
jgi:hypothetical protein